MKSAIGIGALLMDGLGDTIRVSLTEDPEFELNPCADLAEVRLVSHSTCPAFVLWLHVLSAFKIAENVGCGWWRFGLAFTRVLT